GGSLQRPSAGLVQCVFGGVVVAVGHVDGGGTVLGVNDIEDGDAALGEGEMVVLHGFVQVKDVGCVAGVFGGLGKEVEEPGGGVVYPVDVQVFVADHVSYEEGFDLLDRAVG